MKAILRHVLPALRGQVLIIKQGGA
jgi:hypothetical protein